MRKHSLRKGTKISRVRLEKELSETVFQRKSSFSLTKRTWTCIFVQIESFIFLKKKKKRKKKGRGVLITTLPGLEHFTLD